MYLWLRARRVLTLFNDKFCWEPEGYYCRTVILPLCFSTDHLCTALLPFWFSTDDIKSACIVLLLNKIYKVPQNCRAWAAVELEVDEVVLNRDGEEVSIIGVGARVDQDPWWLLGLEDDLHLEEGEVLVAQGAVGQVGGMGAVEGRRVDLNHWGVIQRGRFKWINIIHIAVSVFVNQIKQSLNHWKKHPRESEKIQLTLSH